MAGACLLLDEQSFLSGVGDAATEPGYSLQPITSSALGGFTQLAVGRAGVGRGLGVGVHLPVGMEKGQEGKGNRRGRKGSDLNI
jgi:hypothetical protein